MERLIEKSLEHLMDVNLHSAAGRQAVVKEIMKRIRSKKHPYFLILGTIDDKIPEYWDAKEKEKWICEYCGLSTFDMNHWQLVDKNHRGCERQELEEMENE